MSDYWLISLKVRDEARKIGSWDVALAEAIINYFFRDGTGELLTQANTIGKGEYRVYMQGTRKQAEDAVKAMEGEGLERVGGEGAILEMGKSETRPLTNEELDKRLGLVVDKSP
jgi:hypothetical protein